MKIQQQQNPKTTRKERLVGAPKNYVDFHNRRNKKLILKLEDQKFKNVKIGGLKMHLNVMSISSTVMTSSS
jgi:hypothetical protein